LVLVDLAVGAMLQLLAALVVMAKSILAVARGHHAALKLLVVQAALES
jgi:hypothetical protein